MCVTVRPFRSCRPQKSPSALIVFWRFWALSFNKVRYFWLHFQNFMPKITVSVATNFLLDLEVIYHRVASAQRGRLSSPLSKTFFAFSISPVVFPSDPLHASAEKASDTADVFVWSVFLFPHSDDMNGRKRMTMRSEELSGNVPMRSWSHRLWPKTWNGR